jgi:hypothetical protein
MIAASKLTEEEADHALRAVLSRMVSITIEKDVELREAVGRKRARTVVSLFAAQFMQVGFDDWTDAAIEALLTTVVQVCPKGDLVHVSEVLASEAQFISSYRAECAAEDAKQAEETATRSARAALHKYENARAERRTRAHTTTTKGKKS